MITPADSPSSPSDYAAVAVQPLNIQAPQDDLTGAFNASNAVAGAGVLYAQGPRQVQTEALLESPQGYGAINITAGYAGDWPNNPEPDVAGP